MFPTRRQVLASVALLPTGISCSSDSYPGTAQRPPKSVGEIQRRLVRIISDQLGVEESMVRTETSFVDDLNADSLDVVELIMAMEEEFAITISDEEADKMRTVGDAIKFVAARNSL